MVAEKASIADGVEPSLRKAYELFPPVKYGPVWQKDKAGHWVIPRLTLGWDIIEWCYDNLKGYDGGDHLEFTPEQERFILWFYAVDPKGEFVWRKAMFQRLKGWGKDPLAGALALVELIGPCYFSHFDKETGDPVGTQHPEAWVQLAATTAEQTKNTMKVIPGLLPKATIAKYRLDVMRTQINIKGTSRSLETISSNYAAAEGNRPTFVLMNEPHHWLSGNHGHDLFEVLDRNTDKVSGRWLMITNAYEPGQNSVAERQRQAVMDFLEGRAEDPGVLYDSLEAHPLAPLTPEWAEFIVMQLRGDSVWVNAADLAKAIRNTAVAPEKFRRFYFNQTVADSDSLYGEPVLDAIARPDEVLESGDEIVLGFDGGKTDDATALVAMRVRDQAFFLMGLWQKPDAPGYDKWEVNKSVVHSVVHMMFNSFKVRAFYADVALWEADIDQWADTYRECLWVKPSANHAVAYDMRGNLKRTTLFHERLVQGIYDAPEIEARGEVGIKLAGPNYKLLRRHMLNAQKRQNTFGMSFGKVSREHKRKVDAYAAMLLAFIAWRDLVERGSEVAAPKSKILYGW